MAWNDLTFKDRAQAIKIGVSNGLTNMAAIRDSYNRFAMGGELLKDDFDDFNNTLPDNLKDSPQSGYNMRRYWELNSRPKSFNEGINRGMFTKQEDGYHASSVTYNSENNTYEFMKSKKHPSVNRELDWYYGTDTIDRSSNKESSDFRRKYALVTDKNNPDYYKYVPRDSGIPQAPWNRYSNGGNLYDSGGSTSNIDLNLLAQRQEAQRQRVADWWNAANNTSSQGYTYTPSSLPGLNSAPDAIMQEVVFTAPREEGITPRWIEDDYLGRDQVNALNQEIPKRIPLTKSRLIGNMRKGSERFINAAMNMADVSNLPFKIITGQGNILDRVAENGKTWGQLTSDALGIENPYGRIAMELTNPIDLISGGIVTKSKAIPKNLTRTQPIIGVGDVAELQQSIKNTLSSSKPSQSPSHLHKIWNDIKRPSRWKKIKETRRNGEYPITKKETLQYYRRALGEQQKAIDWTRDMIAKAPTLKADPNSAYDVLFNTQKRVDSNLESLLKKQRLQLGNRYVSQHGYGSFGVYNHDNTYRSYVMLTEPDSNLPATHLSTVPTGGYYPKYESIRGVSAHELNHGIQDISRSISTRNNYFESFYDPKISYRNVDIPYLEMRKNKSPNHMLDYNQLLPLASDTYTPTANTYKRSSWEHSPNEVWSEFANYRASQGIPYSTNGYSDEIVNRFIDDFHKRFSLSREDFSGVVDFGLRHNRALGGILNTNR